jgi:hypothetical protein
LEPLVQSLLFEGYALYPYTPGDVKNATPTPFGIVYPPEYAAASKYTFDHLFLDTLIDGGAEVFGDIRFLQGNGDTYQAVPRRLELDWVSLEDADQELPFEFGGTVGRVIMRAAREGSRWRVSLEVRNETPGCGGAERKVALHSSLISTHAVLHVRGGTFVSPLDGGTTSVNTFPVLAVEDDTAMLGAAIMLPDHPQLAPESKVDFFDGTEIEEALMIHVHTLSEEDRKEMAHGDPAVAEMIGRALSATPQDIFNLHGRTEIAGHPAAGEAEVVVDGVAFRPAMKVILHPSSTDPYDAMLAGRTGTIHRIYVDYEDRTHLGITVDGDPVGDMMRDTGRYLYFFPPEVEILDAEA